MRSITRPLPIALALLLGLAGSGLFAQSSGVVRPSPVTRYTLSASLDASNRLIVGHGRVEWRNATLSATSELRILTPWNGRRHDRTTWANERRLEMRQPGRATDDRDRGFTDLTSLQLLTPTGPVDLLGRATAEAPDDGNVEDQTVWRLPLDEPIAPGHTVELEFKWNAHVPALDDGVGASGLFFLAGQWFPRLAVLTDEGWQARQLHIRSATFTDFGHYSVDLRIPSHWMIGATGQAIGRQDHGDGFTTHRYRAEHVPDFAWTTSPDFAERTDRFVEAGLAPVELRVLVRREHLDQADRQLTAAKAALKTYGRWFGSYPLGQMTLVDTPGPRSSDAAPSLSRARTYPGLLPIQTRWVTPWTGPEPEREILKHVASQYWSVVAGVDVTTDAWLGDGLAAFSSERAMDDAFAGRFVTVERYFGGIIAWPYADVAWNRLSAPRRMALARAHAAADPSSTPAWRQHPASLDTNLAMRTPLVMVTLERLLGWDVLGRTLSTYFARGSFRHPTPDEFMAITNSTSGRDVTWFFDATHRSEAVFDYGVRSVSSIETGTDALDTTVVVERLASGVFPVEVRIVFEDGASVVERWDGREAWRALKYRRGSPVATVEVDPDRVLALDVHRTNNSWTSRPQAREAADSWTLRWAVWFQHLLMTYAFIV